MTTRFQTLISKVYFSKMYFCNVYPAYASSNLCLLFTDTLVCFKTTKPSCTYNKTMASVSLNIWSTFSHLWDSSTFQWLMLSKKQTQSFKKVIKTWCKWQTLGSLHQFHLGNFFQEMNDWLIWCTIDPHNVVLIEKCSWTDGCTDEQMDSPLLDV